jgi:hypothetical protein
LIDLFGPTLILGNRLKAIGFEKKQREHGVAPDDSFPAGGGRRRARGGTKVDEFDVDELLPVRFRRFPRLSFAAIFLVWRNLYWCLAVLVWSALGNDGNGDPVSVNRDIVPLLIGKEAYSRV